MDRYFNRQGEPIDLMSWSKSFENIDEKRVRETTLPDGKWISTVWLGLNHNFCSSGPPLIFETMVFPKEGEYGELDCNRYSTEEEAIAGHEAMVERHKP